MRDVRQCVLSSICTHFEVDRGILTFAGQSSGLFDRPANRKLTFSSSILYKKTEKRTICLSNTFLSVSDQEILSLLMYASVKSLTANNP